MVRDTLEPERESLENTGLISLRCGHEISAFVRILLCNLKGDMKYIGNTVNGMLEALKMRA